MRAQDGIGRVEVAAEGGARWVFAVVPVIAEGAMQRGHGAWQISSLARVEPRPQIASPLVPTR